MNLKDILHLTIFWKRWTRKLSKPILTDADLAEIEQDIIKDLHINEPAGKVYKHKNNKYNH